ncbi:MAG: hypothetical protein SGARI_000866, partial [Bacillariaceae sp.]
MFGGNGNNLAQWSQLSQVTTCVQGYTVNGQTIVDNICYDLEICSDGDKSSICGCSAQYNGQACQGCVPCPNGRGIALDCSNIDPDFYSIACVRSLRFASEWRSFDIRDDKDFAEMMERYREDWQDEAIDFWEAWQEAWGDLLPHTLFRNQQLCDALHDFTAPVLNGEGLLEQVVTCDCDNAIAESDTAYLVSCQSTQVCDTNNQCGAIQSTARIVEGEATTLQACADYDRIDFQRACLTLEICDVNGQHVLCNPIFTYNGIECSASFCNSDATALSFDCSEAAGVTFPTCQVLEPDGLMRFLPMVTGGGSNVDTPVSATPAPTMALPPPESTVMTTPSPTIQGTTIVPTPLPTMVVLDELVGEMPSTKPSTWSSDMPSSLPSSSPTTDDVTSKEGPTTPIPFLAQTDKEESEEEQDDVEDEEEQEDEKESKDEQAASTAASDGHHVACTILTSGFALLLLLLIMVGGSTTIPESRREDGGGVLFVSTKRILSETFYLIFFDIGNPFFIRVQGKSACLFVLGSSAMEAPFGPPPFLTVSGICQFMSVVFAVQLRDPEILVPKVDRIGPTEQSWYHRRAFVIVAGMILRLLRMRSWMKRVFESIKQRDCDGQLHCTVNVFGTLFVGQLLIALVGFMIVKCGLYRDAVVQELVRVERSN